MSTTKVKPLRDEMYSHGRGFAQRQPRETNTREAIRGAAHTERTIMAAEFGAWCVKTRQGVQEKAIGLEHRLRETELLARTAFDVVEDSTNVPNCVLDYLHGVFALSDCHRLISLIDHHYAISINNTLEDCLPVSLSNTREFAELWEWFMGDHGAKLIEQQLTAQAKQE